MNKGKYGPINTKPGKSGEKYVHLNPKRKKYEVWIPVHGERRASGHPKQICLGRFNTLAEAIRARDKYLDS